MEQNEREILMGTIVIATDGSKAAEDAAELGMSIAEQTGDHVVFVAVWDAVQVGFGAPWAYVDQRFIEEDRDRAEQVLGAYDARAEKLGIDAEAVLLQGDPTTQICKAAAERQARMLVIGSHGWGAMRGFLYGSTATGILRLAPCPVLCGTPDTREFIPVEELAAGEATAWPAAFSSKASK